MVGTILVWSICAIIIATTILIRSIHSPMSPEALFKKNCVDHGDKYNVDISMNYNGIELKATCEMVRK